MSLQEIPRTALERQGKLESIGSDGSSLAVEDIARVVDSGHGLVGGFSPLLFSATKAARSRGTQQIST